MNKDIGVTDDKGVGTLSNIKFLDLEDDFFSVPNDFKEK